MIAIIELKGLPKMHKPQKINETRNDLGLSLLMFSVIKARPSLCKINKIKVSNLLLAAMEHTTGKCLDMHWHRNGNGD